MERNINEIEDALFQVKNLEESLKKNAQGILSSTMKEEISSLVKESLKKEVDEEDVEDDDIDASDDTDNMPDDVDGSEEDDVDNVDFEEDDFIEEPPVNPEDDEVSPIDLRGEKNIENVMKVWMSMDDNDGIIVTKDNEMINLSDKNTGKEYMISLNESESEFDLDAFLSDPENEFTGDDEEDYFGDDFDYSQLEEMMDEYMSKKPMEETQTMYELELDDEGEGYGVDDYGLNMPEDDSDIMAIGEFDEDYDLDFSEFDEDYDVDTSIMESKKGKSGVKGVGIGSGPKFKYGKTADYPTKKQPPAFSKDGVKAKGTGKAKFEYDEDVNMDGYSEKPKMKRKETKEASRTLGNGSNFRKGGLAKPRAHSKSNTAINEELQLMREKNEEYRKALNLFRNKLNEVAVFNSNLAYVTRLFTEHSTTKQEKINILRRFDNIETIKESKNLYKVIKSELGSGQESQQTIKESVQRTVEKTPSTGSAANLIESKTYENPQFLRMKDLMKKL
jgi:hypothetical protein